MSKLTLTYRFGEQRIAPQRFEMRRALSEMFEESSLGLPEGDLADHPSSWLTLGWEAGDKWTVLVVDIRRGGVAMLSKYADQDDTAPEYEHRRGGVNAEQAIQLWDLLARGAEGELLARFREE